MTPSEGAKPIGDGTHSPDDRDADQGTRLSPRPVLSASRSPAGATKDSTFQPELSRFVHQMEYKLRLHALDRGESWKEPGWDILARLIEELKEATAHNASPMEWADVANFAFFAWYRALAEFRERTRQGDMVDAAAIEIVGPVAHDGR